METILNILKNIRSDVDFEKEEGLVTNEILDSIEMNVLIAELEDAFNIEIGMEYMEKKNFDSVNAILAMVNELQRM